MNKKEGNRQLLIIEKSHKRSKSMGVNPTQIYPKKMLVFDELRNRLSLHKSLIDTATPFITELYNFLKNSGYFVILTDADGCILTLIGDDEIVNESHKFNMIPGAFMSEESVGTNAMGTALIENRPLQFTADEHYITAYHKWTCSAAPIHDTDGKIIGTINLTGYCENAHPHTLGLVVAAVRAIENHLENINIQKQLYDSNMFAFAMMNNLSYGVFAIDLNDDIHWINNTACDTLNIRRLHLLNKPINQFIKDWNKLKRRVLTENNILDEEVNLSISGEKHHLSYQSIPNKNS